MSGRTGCRIKLPKNMTVDFFMDMFLNSEYDNETLREMIDDYEEGTNGIVYDADGSQQDQLKKKYQTYGSSFWQRDNPNTQIERVLLDLPNDILKKMFPEATTYHNLAYIETGEYDAKGNPVMETVIETDPKTLEEIDVERHKKDLWWIEYDSRDRFGTNAKVCNNKFWTQAWEKMLETLIERTKTGGIAQAIAEAHRANVSKHPAITPLEVRIGNETGMYVDEDGDECMSFDVIMIDNFDENFSEAEEDDEEDVIQSF